MCCGNSVLSTYLTVVWCSLFFFFVVLWYLEPTHAPPPPEMETVCGRASLRSLRIIIKRIVKVKEKVKDYERHTDT